MVKPPARRFRFINWLTIAAVIVLAKPVWHFGEQQFVRRLLGPDMQMSACRVVNSYNVASLANVSWQATSVDNAQLTFNSEQIWAKYDLSQLLRKRFHFSEIRAENVTIRLSDLPTSAKQQVLPLAERWRRELESKLAAVVPEHLVESSKLIAGASQQIAAWENQFNSWLERGSMIVQRSRHEESQLQQLVTNPLRSQPEIVTVLSNLQVLKQEFDQADREIKEAEKLLEDQRRSMVSLKQTDLAEINALFAGLPTSIAQQMGHAIVVEWCNSCWHQYSGICESVDLALGRSRFLDIAPSDGIDYRPSSIDLPLVMVHSAAARGKFELGQQVIPFVAKGKHTQTSLTGITSNSTWRVEGTLPTEDVVLAVRDRSAQPKSQRDVALASYLRTQSQPSTAKQPQLELTNKGGHTHATGRPMFEMKCSVVDSQLSGSAMLDLNQWMQHSANRQNNLIAAVRGNNENDEATNIIHCVHVRIGGSWRKPTISLIDNAPEWIAARLDREYLHAVKQAHQQTLGLFEQRQATVMQSLAKLVTNRRTQLLSQYRQLRAQLVLAEKVQSELIQRGNQGFVRRIQVAPTVTR